MRLFPTVQNEKKKIIQIRESNVYEEDLDISQQRHTSDQRGKE